MTSKTLYRHYLAADRMIKRLEGFGLTVTNVSFSDIHEVGYFRDEYNKGTYSTDSVPFHYSYPEVRVDILREFFFKGLPPDLYYDGDPMSEYQQFGQKAREKFILDFVKKYPDTLVVRNQGITRLYLEAFDGIGVTVTIGQALCERVLVREEFEEVPDPEALEEATRDVPLVKKVKPIYEWRCNDAELEGVS